MLYTGLERNALFVTPLFLVTFFDTVMVTNGYFYRYFLHYVRHNFCICNFQSSTLIEGRWHRRRKHVERNWAKL